MFKIPIPLKAIPMVLDDSFTPAELLTKITFKINEIIEATNTLATDKVDVNQGIEKAGFFLKVNEEGKVVAIESGGVMANWGDIGGNIINQTDLMNLINNGLNLKLDKNDVENSLTSDSTTDALSAYQGKLLNQLIDAINNSKVSVRQGTENAGKYLRVDSLGNVRPMDSSGGSINWGDITGNIAQQVDLMQIFLNITDTIGTWTSELGANIATAIGNLQSAVNTINTTIGTWTSALGADIATAISNIINKLNIVIYENETINYKNPLNIQTYFYNNAIRINIFLKKTIPTNKNITLTNIRLGLFNEKGLLKIDGSNFVNITYETLSSKGTMQITNENTYINLTITYNTGVSITNSDGTQIGNFTPIGGTIDRLTLTLAD